MKSILYIFSLLIVVSCTAPQNHQNVVELSAETTSESTYFIPELNQTIVLDPSWVLTNEGAAIEWQLSPETLADDEVVMSVIAEKFDEDISESKFVDAALKSLKFNLMHFKKLQVSNKEGQKTKMTYTFEHQGEKVQAISVFWLNDNKGIMLTVRSNESAFRQYQRRFTYILNGVL